METWGGSERFPVAYTRIFSSKVIQTRPSPVGSSKLYEIRKSLNCSKVAQFKAEPNAV